MADCDATAHDLSELWSWRYASIPLVAALIGYVTNLLAIQMTFLPLEYIGWGEKFFHRWGFSCGWQGIIPSKAEKMARKAVRLITTKLIRVQDVFDQLEPAEIVKCVEPKLQHTVERVLHEVASTHCPDVWETLPLVVRSEVARAVCERSPPYIEAMMRELKGQIEEILDLEEFVVEKLTEDPELLGEIWCGCFVAGGLAAGVGGASCDDPKVWRAHRQPAPHADFQPRCPQDCLRRGDCDWQGFCRCRRGFWGLDCALTRGADGAPVVDLPDAPRRPEAAAAAPRVYVLDMPPLLRFGNPFAPHFGAKLELRFLRGAQRAADPRTAEYVFLPGVPLVVDGHRLLARLWHARQHFSMWNASRAARHALLLLTERAQYDALQLSSNADDRETWPPALLARAPHAAGILALSSSRCASLDDRMMPWKASRRRCELGAEFEPASPTRRWLGLQFTGNRDPASKFTAFVRGVDIVLPQLLLIRRGGSHADQPSCDQMARTSPFSPAFDRHARHRNRSTLLWFGGHPGIASTARSRLIAAYASRPGYVLRDTRDPSRRIDATNMSLSSAFCWVPRGQGEGDPTRHMIAIFHGCVPVFSLGVASADDALPFDEVLPWDAFSLRVPTDRLGRLPAALRAAAAPARLAQRQAALACAWRALYWSSIEGSCFGEAGDDGGDAFGTLLAVLASRLRGAAQPPSNACDGVDLPEHLEAQGHPGRPARWLAPGSTFTQSG